jgi:hypothetical protein
VAERGPYGIEVTRNSSGTRAWATCIQRAAELFCGLAFRFQARLSEERATALAAEIVTGKQIEMGVKKTGKGRRKLGRKKRRMRAKIRHRK